MVAAVDFSVLCYVKIGLNMWFRCNLYVIMSLDSCFDIFICYFHRVMIVAYEIPLLFSLWTNLI